MSNYDNIEDSSLYCKECLADTSVDCICKKILCYDARTGFPILEDEESDTSNQESDYEGE
jgi:hypothetical protein